MKWKMLKYLPKVLPIALAVLGVVIATWGPIAVFNGCRWLWK